MHYTGAARKSASAGGGNTHQLRVLLLAFGNSQILCDLRAGVEFAFRGNASSDFLDKSLNRRQAEAAEPCRPRCEEGLEGALQRLRAHAAAVVRDFYFNGRRISGSLHASGHYTVRLRLGLYENRTFTRQVVGALTS